MKALVVYDSYFGNTETVAKAVAGALHAEAKRVKDVSSSDFQGLELLVVRSPTRAFRPSDATRKFLADLPGGSLKGVKVAAFDTRIRAEDTNSGLLKVLVKIFGYAAQPIVKGLAKKGGLPSGTAEGFVVKASEGPLADGETTRAADWAKTLA